MTSSILTGYSSHVAERNKQGLPPLPLTFEQTSAVCSRLREGNTSDSGFDLLELLSERIDPGVTDGGKVKAELLGDVAKGEIEISGLSIGRSIELLGSMQGGYNVEQLVALLDQGGANCEAVVSALSDTLLISEPDFRQVDSMRSSGNVAAGQVVTNWAEATWFTSRPEVLGEIELVVYRIEGEINTDDFSPAKHAPSRDDIPLHALSFLQKRNLRPFRKSMI